MPKAVKAGRHGTRDHLLLMMMFRHGLRVSEAVSLQLDELDLAGPSQGFERDPHRSALYGWVSSPGSGWPL
jgi:integrase